MFFKRVTPFSIPKVHKVRTVSSRVGYRIGTATTLSSLPITARFAQSFRLKSKLMSPLLAAPYDPFVQRVFEVHRGKTPVKLSRSLETIYRTLPQTLNEHVFFTYSNAIPPIQIDSAESFFKNQSYYKQYAGRAPMVNGSYYFGTSRKGGVLGDIFIDLNSKEFDSSKKKLIELKSLGLPRSEIVAKFVDFFRSNILDNSLATCLRLKKSHEISKAAGIMPLSAIIFRRLRRLSSACTCSIRST